MNGTEKWVFGGLCAALMAMGGYGLNQIDCLKTQVSDLRAQLAQYNQKVDDMISHRENRGQASNTTKLAQTKTTEIQP